MAPVSAVRWKTASAADIDTLVRIDEEAEPLFRSVGIVFSGPQVQAFAAVERARWLRACDRGLAQLIIDLNDRPVAFSVFGHVDGRPYLDQLSVVADSMRRGLGRALLAHAYEWAAPHRELWLTTYAHVPWNGPMYERAGFVRVGEAACGPGMRAILDEQRSALPAPEQRIAMVRRV